MADIFLAREQEFEHHAVLILHFDRSLALLAQTCTRCPHLAATIRDFEVDTWGEAGIWPERWASGPRREPHSAGGFWGLFLPGQGNHPSDHHRDPVPEQERECVNILSARREDRGRLFQGHSRAQLGVQEGVWGGLTPTPPPTAAGWPAGEAAAAGSGAAPIPVPRAPYRWAWGHRVVRVLGATTVSQVLPLPVHHCSHPAPQDAHLMLNTSSKNPAREGGLRPIWDTHTIPKAVTGTQGPGFMVPWILLST